ncbi:protein artemis isoform X2 [Linepithema humile]|nr:PREDICTED: protein artemis isoform X2 [Linepithema humile]
MSTFLGFIEEIPGISVDRFNEKNCDSSIYFLSHCHTDHMQGLTNQFFKHLQQCNRYLYCSEISKTFLQAKYRYTDTCVKHIDIDKKELLEYKSDMNKNDNVDVLYVTCISAGHCPGSVMFLFEKTDKLILYTGDFRLDPRSYKDIVPLHFQRNFNEFPRKLAQIYLDTTFLDPNYTFLPSRKESIRAICKVTTKWLKDNSKNIVVLECPALYGYESIYIELSKALNECIHIKDFVSENYYSIPHLARYVTNDPQTRIHACTNKNERSGLKCRSIPEENILFIVPSVLQWEKKDASVIEEWNNARERTYNVCFSTHASFDELKKFILYFKPEKIHPCVCPPGFERKIYSLLNEIQSKIGKEKNVVQNCENYTLQILEQVEVTNKQWIKHYFHKVNKNYS